MIKRTCFLMSAMLVLGISSCTLDDQETLYKPTKESIMQHPTPEWFKDVRIGVFIHFVPRGEDPPVPDQFSADKWIDLFENAGAEYFVFTTKHNNGWCNWPSTVSEHGAQEKNGPRDLVTPLVETARKAGMKVGLYYNLMDRYEGVTTAMADNPELEPSEEYALDYLHPHIKELVSTYEPDLLWTDGDWISTSDRWHSNEIVAWLYNWAEKENREICLTDRWGKDIRITEAGTEPQKYGDYWTLEIRIMADIVTTHSWESSLTPFSGWVYKENYKFRASMGELITTMCDICSRGGKLLLNIGPKPDGTISENDRDMLLGLGRWLEVNGEAIYGTSPVDVARDISSENLLERAQGLLVPDTWFIGHPETWDLFSRTIQDQGPVRFTTKDSYTYAILLEWPGELLEMDMLPIKPGTEIRMLGVEEPLSWKEEGEKLIVNLPSEKPCEYAFVLKMELV